MKRAQPTLPVSEPDHGRSPGPKVVDTNVLTIASGAYANWSATRIPLQDPELRQKVFDWVKAFRDDTSRSLVLDSGQTIFEEYTSRANMHDPEHYGRRVIQHKMQTGAITWVQLNYQYNGDERVARLPEEVEALVHDLGDRKMLAAAFEAPAPIINACDSDWDSPKEKEALRLLDIDICQLLNAQERVLCRERDHD